MPPAGRHPGLAQSKGRRGDPKTSILRSLVEDLHRQVEQLYFAIRPVLEKVYGVDILGAKAEASFSGVLTGEYHGREGEVMCASQLCLTKGCHMRTAYMSIFPVLFKYL